MEKHCFPCQLLAGSRRPFLPLPQPTLSNRPPSAICPWTTPLQSPTHCTLCLPPLPPMSVAGDPILCRPGTDPEPAINSLPRGCYMLHHLPSTQSKLPRAVAQPEPPSSLTFGRSLSSPCCQIQALQSPLCSLPSTLAQTCPGSPIPLANFSPGTTGSQSSDMQETPSVGGDVLPV